MSGECYKCRHYGEKGSTPFAGREFRTNRVKRKKDGLLMKAMLSVPQTCDLTYLLSGNFEGRSMISYALMRQKVSDFFQISRNPTLTSIFYQTGGRTAHCR